MLLGTHQLFTRVIIPARSYNFFFFWGGGAPFPSSVHDARLMCRFFQPIASSFHTGSSRVWIKGQNTRYNRGEAWATEKFWNLQRKVKSLSSWIDERFFWVSP